MGLKLAFFSTPVLEYGGGLEKYYIETVSHLAGQDGVAADVITMDDNYMDRMTSWLQVFYMKKLDKKANYKEKLPDIQARLGKARYYKAHSAKELRNILQKYDIIYTKNEILESFILRFFVGYDHLPPVIFGGHTPLAYPNPQSFHAKLHNFLYAGPIYRFLAAKASKYHVLNSQEEALYSRLFQPAKVHKIYNPFDIAAFKRNAAEFPYPLQPKPGALNIFWAGRLTEQKGVEDLVHIIEALNRDLPNPDGVTWTIAGDGDLRSLIEKLVGYQNVTYLGHVDQRYMSSLYAARDVFLSTSKWEGYPYNLLEARAWDLAIIAYDIPGASDILQSYSRGRLVASPEQVVSQILEWADKGLDPPGKQAGTAQFEPAAIYQQLTQLLTP